MAVFQGQKTGDLREDNRIVVLIEATYLLRHKNHFNYKFSK